MNITNIMLMFVVVVIVFVTILVICQVLTFIYALVVIGWRGETYEGLICSK